MIGTITTIVAIYGAVLSTYALYLRWEEHKPRIKVELTPGIAYYGSSRTEPAYLITAKNFGAKPIKLVSIYLPLTNGSKYYFGLPADQGRLPCLLNPADSITFNWQISDLNNKLKAAGYNSETFTVYFADALGNEYHSNHQRII